MEEEIENMQEAVKDEQAKAEVHRFMAAHAKDKVFNMASDGEDLEKYFDTCWKKMTLDMVPQVRKSKILRMLGVNLSTPK